MNVFFARQGWRLATAVMALLFVCQTWRLNHLRHSLRTHVETSKATPETLARDVPGGTAAPGNKSGGNIKTDRQARIGQAAATYNSASPRAATPATGSTTSLLPPPAASATTGSATIPGETADPSAAAEAQRRVTVTAGLLEQARNAIAKGDYDSAVAALNKTLEQDPANATALQMMATICHNLGLRDDERFYYETWRAAQPDAPMPYYHLARLFSEQGLGEQAKTAAQQFEALSKNNGAAAASLYRQLNMAAEEGRVLQNWVAANPGAVEAHRWLGEYYQRQGQPGAAIAEYQRVVTIDPGDVEAHLSLASAYQNLRQFANAQTEITAAVTLRPGDMMLRLRLADSYRQNGNLNAAAGEYQGIINYAPQSVAGKVAVQQLEQLQRQSASRP